MTNFRDQFVYSLSKSFNLEEVQFIVNQLDMLLNDFEITPKNQLILVDDTDLVQSYLRSKIADGIRKSSIKSYFCKITEFMRTIDKPLREITTDDIRKYLAYRIEIEHRSLSTVNHDRLSISGLFTWLHDEGYITKDPVKKIKSIKDPGRKRFALTDREVEKMRYACRNNLRLSALFEILYSTGIRNGEIRKLRTSDINWESKEITVTGKGNKTRNVPLHPRTEEIVYRYINSINDIEYLFYPKGHKNTPISGDSIADMIKGLAKNAHLNRKVVPHDLRHTFATRALKAGMPLEEIQVILGHSDISTTRIYAEIDADKLRHDCKIYL